MAEPTVSVIIPAWNSAECIRSCLDAVIAQDLGEDQIEIIVVDNGSSDATPDLVRSYPSVVLLSEPEPGSYRARNRGLERARGHYVAFTDSDCIPASDWLSTGLAAARRAPAAGVIAGRIRLDASEAGGSRTCRLFESRFAFNQASNVKAGTAVTANWLSPRALLVEEGGFNAELKSGGDVALSRRLRAKGLEIVYVPEMVVSHAIRSRFGELVAKRRRTTGGRWQSFEGTRRMPSLLTAMGFENARRIKGVLSDADLEAVERIKLSVLVGALALVAMSEVVRLELGGRPTRA
jgi:glycosyltransferase involved in cell wall biosynthesis